MIQKYSSILIVIAVAASVLTVIAGWMKLMHKMYADDALTISHTINVATVILIVAWVLFRNKKKEIKV